MEVAYDIPSIRGRTSIMQRKEKHRCPSSLPLYDSIDEKEAHANN
jgi:hypothetical protein